MQLETFRGPTLAFVLKQVRAVLGEDAMIVRSESVTRGGQKLVEVLAADPKAIETFRKRLDGGRAAAIRARGRSRKGPYRVAFVGPAGAGKTTTTVKVAMSPRGVAGRRVGFVTLDTYRVGGIEELQTYAEITNLPLEVVYHPSEVAGALERLAHVDVVLIDTPGRSFDGDGATWLESLEALDPDEVHAVIPAGCRTDVAQGALDRLRPARPTHVLLTKLDEVPGDQGLVALVEALDLPTRWVADGVEIPAALGPAPSRILSALGIPSQEPRATALRAG